MYPGTHVHRNTCTHRVVNGQRQGLVAGKVGQVNPVPAGDHYVFGLDVSMTDTDAVALLQRQQQLVDDPTLKEGVCAYVMYVRVQIACVCLRVQICIALVCLCLYMCATTSWICRANTLCTPDRPFQWRAETGACSGADGGWKTHTVAPSRRPCRSRKTIERATRDQTGPPEATT